MSWNLNTVIREVVAESDDPNPHHLVAEVVARVPSNRLRDALRACVIDKITEAVRNERSTLVTASSGGPTRSTRWERASADIGRLLRRRESLGDGKWKFLGDMTADEVHLSGELRINAGKATIAAGEKMVMLAEHMRQTGAAIVSEVDPDVLGGAL